MEQKLNGLGNSAVAKRFLIALAAAEKRHYERNEARKTLREHLDRLNAQKAHSKKDIEELERRISHLIERESSFARRSKYNIKVINELKVRIRELEERLSDSEKEKENVLLDNRQQIAELSAVIASLRDRIGRIAAERLRREERLNALERRISAV